MYVNYCHECARALSSVRAERCERCAWLRCACGACGCTYQAAGVRAVLATVPPVWGAVAPRHVASARVSGSRLRAAGPAVVFATVAVVLAVGLAALTSWLAPEVAVAPELASVPMSAEPEAPLAGSALAPAVASDEPVVPEATAAAAAPAPAAASAPLLAVASADAARPTASEPPRSAVVDAPRPAPASASVPALPAVLYVGNTDRQGAFLRSQPRDGNDTRLAAWQDGTAMTPLETTTVQEAGGPSVWVRVRDPRGDAGWLRQGYLGPSR